MELLLFTFMTFLSSVKSSNLLNTNILHDKLTYYFLTFFLLFCQKVIYLYQIKTKLTKNKKMSINIINRNNTKIYTTLTVSEEGKYLKFWLRTKSNGFVNHYEITAKISGLLECKESSLYFNAISVENMNKGILNETTNQETLIDEAVIDIFDELTQ